jgi:predicted nucleic acid-binding protein
MKIRDILRILRYLFDDVLTTQHSLNVERQMAVTSLLTLEQKPDTSDLRKEHTVSIWDVIYYVAEEDKLYQRQW